MSLVFMDDKGQVQGDVDELGRRLRAMYLAMVTLRGTHEQTVVAYSVFLAEVSSAESHDVEGSWAWWAKKMLCDPAQYDVPDDVFRPKDGERPPDSNANSS